MEAVLKCCAGLDVHRDSVVACFLCENAPSQIRTFSTLPSGLEQLRQWLEEQNCRHVAMESTGVYWQPVYQALEGAFDATMVILVTNARHMRNVPGRKTDMKDAEWIASLLRAGLLKGSFIPSQPVRELRDFTRYRKTQVELISAQKNRIEKFLQSAGFKLSTFLSDVFGVSGRAILEYLARHGKISASSVESLVKGRLRHKKEDIAHAVSGSLSASQCRFLTMHLAQLDQMESHLAEIEAELETHLRQFQQQLDLLDGIPGIDVVGAAAILGEIGAELAKFPSANHLCSWAGLSPGNHESAGKKSLPG